MFDKDKENLINRECENESNVKMNTEEKKTKLEIRRSISYEEINENNSIRNLCINLRPYHLDEQFNKFMEKCSNENEFNWWKTIEHLKPLIQKRIFNEFHSNEFEESENNEFILFIKCKRYERRNGLCFVIDRLFYNQQMFLFVTIANQLQIQFNLLSSGF